MTNNPDAAQAAALPVKQPSTKRFPAGHGAVGTSTPEAAMTFGQAVKHYRKLKEFSQEDVCIEYYVLTGRTLSRQAVSNWEHGKNEPTISEARLIAKILGFSTDKLA